MSTKTSWPYSGSALANQDPSVKVTVYLRDFEGEPSTLTFYYASSGFDFATARPLIDAFLASLDTETLAAIVSYDVTFRFGWNESLGTSGSDYGNSDDKAHLVMVNTTSGATQILNLPAPFKSNFLGDTETYNADNGQTIAGYITTAAFTDRDGNGAGGAAYERGYLRRKTHKTHPKGFATEMGAD